MFHMDGTSTVSTGTSRLHFLHTNGGGIMSQSQKGHKRRARTNHSVVEQTKPASSPKRLILPLVIGILVVITIPAILFAHASFSEKSTPVGTVKFVPVSFSTPAPQSQSNVGWNRTFTGQTYDAETGLMYYRGRYYDPASGRFLTRDPIGYDAGDTNLYRYVNNSPTIYTDYDGLKPSGCCKTCAMTSGSLTLNGLEYNSNIKYMSDRGGGNAMMHCLATCRTVRLCGTSCAKEFWDGREGTDLDGQQDLKNNSVGYRLGENSRQTCWNS